MGQPLHQQPMMTFGQQGMQQGAPMQGMPGQHQHYGQPQQQYGQPKQQYGQPKQLMSMEYAPQQQQQYGQPQQPGQWAAPAAGPFFAQQGVAMQGTPVGQPMQGMQQGMYMHQQQGYLLQSHISPPVQGIAVGQPMQQWAPMGHPHLSPMGQSMQQGYAQQGMQSLQGIPLAQPALPISEAPPPPYEPTDPSTSQDPPRYQKQL